MGEDQMNRWWVARSKGLGSTQLRRCTVAYWEQQKPRPRASKAERIKWYIETLLPEELRWADEHNQLKHKACHTLTLLVGYSPEPLFQTIGVFQPQRVVLLLNQLYGSQSGWSRGGDMKRWIDEWLTPLIGRQLDVTPRVIADWPEFAHQPEVAEQPGAVFRELCDHVLDAHKEGEPVIVDITGAKKTMTAGAFLFAAYADIPVSYVDFGEYDQDKFRPFGFTCRIGPLDNNPYETLALHDWERVWHLYRTSHFRAAAHTLSQILGVMRTPIEQTTESDSSLLLFRPKHIQASETLLRMLKFYEAWDDGDYHQAKGLLPDLKRLLPTFSPPIAVTLLGDIWPHTDDTSNAEEAARQLCTLHDNLIGHPHHFFRSNKLLITYARDELARIKRLVKANEDNRSALLRSAGLDELLLKARLVRLWHAGWIDMWEWNWRERKECYRGECRSLDTHLQRRLLQKLIEHDGVKYIRRTLRCDRLPGWTLPAFVKLDTGTEYRARPTSDPDVPCPCPIDYEEGIGLTGETLTELRNRAIHTYLYVTQPIADKALDLAEANLNDFEENWADLSGDTFSIEPRDVKRLPWGEVSDLCGLGFLPLTSQSKDEDRKEEDG